MLLGKRPRPPMIKRTTSMTEFTVVEVEAAPPQTQSFLTPRGYFHGGHDLADDQTTAHFLRSCGLCRRRLAPGRDIYMYRGDAAFCSLECREQQMKQDERKEKKPSHQQQQAADQETNNHQSPHTNKNESNKSRTVAAA